MSSLGLRLFKNVHAGIWRDGGVSTQVKNSLCVCSNCWPKAMTAVSVEGVRG